VLLIKCYKKIKHAPFILVRLCAERRFLWKQTKRRQIQKYFDASERCSAVLIHTVDSDIPIYACYFAERITASMFVKIGVKEKKRIISIDEIVGELGVTCCTALPALHAFTGNDYTSAFCGLGKTKAFKELRKNESFIVS